MRQPTTLGELIQYHQYVIQHPTKEMQEAAKILEQHIVATIRTLKSGDNA